MGIDDFVAELIFGYLAVVARIGAALMFMPAFGEAQFPVRTRLSFSLVLCAVLYPVVPTPAAMPDNTVAIALLLGSEVTIGLWMGLAGRVFLSAMQFAGNQIGQVIGLANAFGPSFGSFEGATMVATLLLISTITVIFATDAHHMILIALVQSYDVFTPGNVIVGDLAETMVRVGSHSLYLGTAVAAPFFVMGVILNLGMGLANRMMPQLPVFFVAASLLIGIGFLILLVATPSAITFFIGDFVEWLSLFQL